MLGSGRGGHISDVSVEGGRASDARASSARCRAPTAGAAASHGRFVVVVRWQVVGCCVQSVTNRRVVAFLFPYWGCFRWVSYLFLSFLLGDFWVFFCCGFDWQICNSFENWLNIRRRFLGFCFKDFLMIFRGFVEYF